MLGSLAVAMYLLGLTLRNTQLVTIAVVIFVFLTWAALLGNHADVASSGRRAEEWSGEEGVALGNVVAMRKLSSARMFEDGELNVTLRMQNTSSLPKILEVRDRVPEVMRIKEGANYILMELGPRRETFIEYTVECPLRGFYSLGPVTVRIQDAFGLFHKEKELHVYNDFLVFPKWRTSKRRSSNPVCRRSSPERSTFDSPVRVQNFIRCASISKAIRSGPSTGRPTLVRAS